MVRNEIKYHMFGIFNKNNKKMQFTQTVDVLKDKKRRVAAHHAWPPD